MRMRLRYPSQEGHEPGGQPRGAQGHHCFAPRNRTAGPLPRMRQAKPGIFSYSNRITMSLVVNDLHVSIAGQEIVRGLSLEIEPGKVHAIMGPNGSGKSTLAKVLGGHPDYTVTSGEALMDGVNILEMEPD